METCKRAFKDVCPNFKFFKFHTIVHCPLQARWFGNIDVMDGNRWILESVCSKFYFKFRWFFLGWEETHKHFAKDIYRATPRRTLTLENDMFNALIYRNKVHAVARQVHHPIRFFVQNFSEISHGKFGIAAPFEGESRNGPNLEIHHSLAWRNFGKKKQQRSTVAEACAGEPIEAIVSYTNYFCTVFQDQFRQYFPHFLVETYHSKNLFGYRRWWHSYQPP